MASCVNVPAAVNVGDGGGGAAVVVDGTGQAAQGVVAVAHRTRMDCESNGAQASGEDCATQHPRQHVAIGWHRCARRRCTRWQCSSLLIHWGARCFWCRGL
jgi:hypothetical protein